MLDIQELAQLERLREVRLFLNCKVDYWPVREFVDSSMSLSKLFLQDSKKIMSSQIGGPDIFTLDNVLVSQTL